MSYPIHSLAEVILEDPLIGAVNKYTSKELEMEDNRLLKIRSKWQVRLKIDVDERDKLEKTLDLFK